MFRKKHPLTFSIISWSIFIIFVSVEREMNTLQITYLQSWWRHNCVTLHVTNVYFMELGMNIGQLYWKTFTFVWIITRRFLVDFYTFWTSGNGKEFFTKSQQNLRHHPNACVWMETGLQARDNIEGGNWWGFEKFAFKCRGQGGT